MTKTYKIYKAQGAGGYADADGDGDEFGGWRWHVRVANVMTSDVASCLLCQHAGKFSKLFFHYSLSVARKNWVTVRTGGI